jgi:hypothetical protein
MRVLAIILSLITLSMTVSSCGKSDSGAGKQSEDASGAPSGSGSSTGTSRTTNQNETIQPDGSNIQGIYGTVLLPVNFNLHFKKVGTAALVREGDSFTAKVDLKYGPRETKVKQAVYTGRRCPNLNDDLNKDAYVDIQEALMAIGSVSIPLDGTLDSQAEGSETSPTGDAVNGVYAYNVVASFSRMFADLKLPDENAGDNMIKLGAEEGLTFPGRVVLLTGVPEALFIPPTVAGLGDAPVKSTVPLACGVLWKMDGMPSL